MEGSYKYKKWGGTCKVRVYKMEVTKVFTKWDIDNDLKNQVYYFAKGII